MDKSETTKRKRLWDLFRITLEEQKKIEDYQRNHPVFWLLVTGNVLGTDHSHASGLLRGRLNWIINRAYGMIETVNPKMTSAILRALADYHDNPPATIVLGKPRYGLLGKAMYKRKMIYGPKKES